MKKMTKRLMCLLLAGMTLFSLAACGGDSGANDSTPPSGSESPSDSVTPSSSQPSGTSEAVEITFYPRDANLSSGVVGGFKGDYFASRGFRLNVWAYSDEKTNGMLASGDLPDVMFIPEQSLDVMIQNGMLLNLDDYLDDMPCLQAYEPIHAALNYVREFKSAGTGSVYGIPTFIGENFAKYKYVDATERNALKLHWANYVAAGSPEITDFYSLIDAMEKMMEVTPQDAEGNPFFGTVLNAGSDTTHWACMTMWYRMQGYLENQLPYLLETDMVNGTYTSILSKDSLYYQGLKWYNEIYKRGLMDPDSITNDRATQKPKVDNGYAQVPSGYLPGWATTYLEYYVPGTKIYYNPSSTYGDVRYMVGINAKTENVEACLAFLDMLSDPDAYLTIMNGPEGDFWYADGNGNAYFSDKALAYLKERGGDMTGYTLENGEVLEIWNTPFIVNNGAPTSYGDGAGGKRSAATGGWTEINEMSIDNDTFKSWQEVTGKENWTEWLNENHAYFSSSPLDNVNDFASLPDDMMQLTIDAIREKVTTASWKMVYAASDAEFDQLWDQMIADCEGLDAQSIIDWRLADLEHAKSVRDSLAS